VHSGLKQTGLALIDSPEPTEISNFKDPVTFGQEIRDLEYEPACRAGNFRRSRSVYL